MIKLCLVLDYEHVFDYHGWIGFGRVVTILPGILIIIEDYKSQEKCEGNYDAAYLQGVIDRHKAYSQYHGDDQYIDSLWSKSMPWKLGKFEGYHNCIKSSFPWYAVSASFMGCYESHWGWDGLNKRNELIWSAAFIEHYKDQWDWSNLSSNWALPWSIEFIDRYKDRWDWFYLSSNLALPWSIELIDRYKDRWNWLNLSGNGALPWSYSFYEKFARKWIADIVVKHYDGNICRLSREQVVGLIELQELRHFDKVEELCEFLRVAISNINNNLIIPTSFGNGLRIDPKEVMNCHIKEHVHKILPIGASALAPLFIYNKTDLLAIATAQGRLLIFPVAELEYGRDNRLIQIEIAELLTENDRVVAAVTLPESGQLKIIAAGGKRQLTLSGADIEQYSGRCGDVGLSLPIGFNRNIGLESEYIPLDKLWTN